MLVNVLLAVNYGSLQIFTYRVKLLVGIDQYRGPTFGRHRAMSLARYLNEKRPIHRKLKMKKACSRKIIGPKYALSKP